MPLHSTPPTDIPSKVITNSTELYQNSKHLEEKRNSIKFSHSSAQSLRAISHSRAVQTRGFTAPSPTLGPPTYNFSPHQRPHHSRLHSGSRSYGRSPPIKSAPSITESLTPPKKRGRRRRAIARSDCLRGASSVRASLNSADGGRRRRKNKEGR